MCTLDLGPPTQCIIPSLHHSAPQAVKLDKEAGSMFGHHGLPRHQ